ncbi:hypothetical protein [Wenyingzhuangia sp. IMCC45574]
MNKITLLVACLLSMAVFSQKLDKSKSNLKSSTSSNSSSNSSSSSYENDDDDDDENSFGEELFLEFIVKPIALVAYATTVEIFIQSHLEEDGNHLYMDLTHHPYSDNQKGDYIYEPDFYNPTRLDLSNQLLFDGNRIFGNNLNAKLRFAQRASLEYNQTYLHESVKGTSYQFFMHDLTANYYRVRTESFTLHYGLGATYVHSGVNKAYFTYKTGMEYFFNRPISIDFEHRGTMGDLSSIYQTNFNINFYKKNYALKAGINLYRIGGVNYNMVGLGGKIYL